MAHSAATHLTELVGRVQCLLGGEQARDCGGSHLAYRMPEGEARIVAPRLPVAGVEQVDDGRNHGRAREAVIA